ncbi:MAG TPA: cytochrome c biogenesis heme-transporting ATPase CcmA [Gammaproteobacteria bacterium]|nr:cytochrome c biogenesis heme-transporting ATPase CcmA [Gammaproteobacteria bacterium]
MSALSANALDIWRGERQLCHQLSFQAAAGEALHLHGANGAGKTTLIRILAGLATPEAGAVCWDGRTLAEVGDDYRRALAYLGHANGLKSNLTPLENLSAHVAMMDATPALSIPDALVQLGIGEAAHRPCASLSMGQQRRTALARLLLSNAVLWLLDEPLASLDAEGARLLAELIRAHLQGGGIAIFATHQPLDLGAHVVRSVSLGAVP